MCVFCDIVNKKIEVNIVYEDKLVIAFLDYDPINEGHILLIPKKHYLDIDELSTDLLSHIMIVSKKIVLALKKKYQLDGYSIMQNGGLFNDVGHYHLHIFPRYKNDGFSWKYSNKKYECNKEIASSINDKIKI